MIVCAACTGNGKSKKMCLRSDLKRIFLCDIIWNAGKIALILDKGRSLREE